MSLTTKKPRPWSLGRRMRGWFMVTTFVVFLMSYLIAGVFLNQSYQDVVTATMREEEEEFTILFSASEGNQESARLIYEDLAHRHPEVSMGFVIWDGSTGEMLASVGAEDLLEEFTPRRDQVEPILEVGSGIYTRISNFSGGHVIGMVMDMSQLGTLVQRFNMFAGLTALLAVALGLGLGEIFSRMTSRQLTRISDAVRQIKSLNEDLHIALADSPTEIRSVVEALSEMLLAIRSENRSSELMIAGLAHELGSPVQNMLGETEVLLQGEAETAEYRRLIEVYQEELHQLSDAVHNLVTLCASRSGSYDDGEVEEFDLGRESGFRLLREQAAAGKREVLLEIDTLGDLMLSGDKESMLRALRNIVSNAIAWSPPRESVSVLLDGSNAEHLTIFVDDAGPGVPVEERENIFEMLYRGPGASGRRVGYGLGLALAHSAITKQGGTITVLDSPLGGARFQIQIPRRSPISASSDGSALLPSFS